MKRRKPRTPAPLPPTEAEIVAANSEALGEAIAALADVAGVLSDASTAAYVLRTAGEYAARQQAKLNDLDERLRRFEQEKQGLEARVRDLLWGQPHTLVDARRHAGRMRNAAVFWEAEARKLGHKGASSLPDYHYARRFM